MLGGDIDSKIMSDNMANAYHSDIQSSNRPLSIATAGSALEWLADGCVLSEARKPIE